MRGWVYVMSNVGIPNLVKIGYSLKDPEYRAKELYTTGVPHPFLVDYDALVEDPREIEVAVHKSLEDKREKKEFFHCSVVEAVKAIEDMAGDRILLSSRKTEASMANSKLAPRSRPESPNEIKKRLANRKQPELSSTIKKRREKW